MKTYFTNWGYKKKKIFLLSALAAVTAFAGCGKTAETGMEPSTVPTQEAESKPSRQPGDEVQPESTPTPAPTLTPEATPTLTSEPAPTGEPTQVPEPTLTPEVTGEPTPTEPIWMRPQPEWFSGIPLELENDTFIDLDVDGEAEHIEYFADYGVAVFINDVKMELEGEGDNLCPIYQDDDVFGEHAEVVSLDGATVQLVLLDYGEGHSFRIRIYTYYDGELHFLGRLPALSYEVKEYDGERYLMASGEDFFVECCIIEKQYIYWDGKLELVPREFYEYQPTWSTEETTARREFVLYADKNGTPGITVPEGCVVDILGGDMEEWALLKNMETGEEGWLRVRDESIIILPDGEEIFSWELFDGLSLYH